ncbi:MAG: hypothetical protein GY945_14525 [Rhodobacteraceae bacterium]|nr:hypothetical protein [Paracoccaceae bacterium]
MTNQIALGLALIIVCIFAVDYFALGGTLPVIAGQKLMQLSEYIAFWR